MSTFNPLQLLDDPATTKHFRTLKGLPAHFIKRMTNEQRKVFQKYVKLEQKYSKPFNIENNDISVSLKNSPSLRIIHQRVVEWGNAQVSTAVAIFLAYLSEESDDNSGKAILWSYTVTCMHYSLKKMVTMNDLAQEFLFGFPTDRGIRDIWKKQKEVDAPNGNLLDVPALWTAKSCPCLQGQ